MPEGLALGSPAMQAGLRPSWCGSLSLIRGFELEGLAGLGLGWLRSDELVEKCSEIRFQKCESECTRAKCIALVRIGWSVVCSAGSPFGTSQQAHRREISVDRVVRGGSGRQTRENLSELD